ncbi:flap endonuclease-1 [Halobacteriales archaeon SW_7_68_16]|nr:MAG: flap endonuclease-1 [Halobacteriales archaeon SW_7_68_16]
MGNASLRDLAAIETVSTADLAGSTIAIDAHNWLYRYLTTTVKWTASDAYTTPDGEEVANLIGVVQGLPGLLEADVDPVFVFDGVPTDLKADEVERRREARDRAEADLEAARETGDPVEISRLESRTQELTPTIQRTTRALLDRLDVPVVEAPAEGEAQAAHMARRGDVDAAGTEDYDALLFGSPVTYRKLTGGDDPERMELAATLERHDLTWEEVIDVGILCGTDFNEGVAGLGPKRAVDAIHEHGDLWGVLEAEDAHVEYADRVRSLFRDPEVTDEYDTDGPIEPDVEAAREFVVEEWHVDPDEVGPGFDRIEAATSQTGLDRWT